MLYYVHEDEPQPIPEESAQPVATATAGASEGEAGDSSNNNEEYEIVNETEETAQPSETNDPVITVDYSEQLEQIQIIGIAQTIALAFIALYLIIYRLFKL